MVRHRNGVNEKKRPSIQTKPIHYQCQYHFSRRTLFHLHVRVHNFRCVLLCQGFYFQFVLLFCRNRSVSLLDVALRCACIVIYFAYKILCQCEAQEMFFTWNRPENSWKELNNAQQNKKEFTTIRTFYENFPHQLWLQYHSKQKIKKRNTKMLRYENNFTNKNPIKQVKNETLEV